MTLKDKVFMVTGGASGIGACVVRNLLLENAAHVAFLDIAEREGAALESEVRSKFGALRAKFIKCDISDEGQLDAAYGQVLDKYRRLDAVINNAAIITAGEHLHRQMIDINFTGTVSSTLKALDLMRADKSGSGGIIINLSSQLALERNAHLPVYSATKIAVLKFSNSLGAEEYYSDTKVRVVTVCLGPTDTAILHRENSKNFGTGCGNCLTSRVAERQRVASAAAGILEVLSKGESGSTWLVANDKPAKDITTIVNEGFEDLSAKISARLKQL